MSALTIAAFRARSLICELVYRSRSRLSLLKFSFEKLFSLLIAVPIWSSGCNPQGRPITCTCAYGVPAHMMNAPVGLYAAGRPEVFGSNGHMIIQCGPMVIGGLVWS